METMTTPTGSGRAATEHGAGARRQKETSMNDTAAGAGDLRTGGDTDALDPEPGHLAELPRSLAVVTTAREGNAIEHQLLISPGATAADVTAAMILMPPAAALVGHRGAGDVALVFREPAGPAADAAHWFGGSSTPEPRDDLGRDDDRA
jgi:uncharacterized repeat protein (TIGR03917 family)